MQSRRALGACLFGIGCLLAGRRAADASNWNSRDGNPTVKTTMEGIDHPNGGTYDHFPYRYDREMRFFEPTCTSSLCPSPRNQLIVILGGHPGPKPTSYDLFQQFAADLGFHSISIDFDYSHEEGTGADADPGLDPGDICGCYTDCYTALHRMVAEGVEGETGIPASRFPVVDRITDVVEYLKVKRSGKGWGQFADGSEPAYAQIVFVGLSRGNAIAAIIAKFHRLSRLVMFSGMNDSVADLAGSDNAHLTSYRWGLTHGGACTPMPVHFPPAYVTDNSWTGGSNATHWETQRNQPDSKIFGYISEANDPTWGRTKPSYLSLGLDAVAGGHVTVGDWASGETPLWPLFDGRFLSPGGLFGDLCGPAAPNSVHVNMLVGACPGLSGAGEAARRHVWEYMLTH